MHHEPPNPSENAGLVIRASTGLVNLPEGVSPALDEIISRSLVHIQTSKALAIRHRIGDYELCAPDYQLVCALAEDVRLTAEEALMRLLVAEKTWPTRIENGRFKALSVDEALPISSFPSIKGLIVESISCSNNRLTELDLSKFPNLTKLSCYLNELTELDLSHVPNLTMLSCSENELGELNLSRVPNLSVLLCDADDLNGLNLSEVPNLTKLSCSNNQLTELDLSQVPNITMLRCVGNQLAELDFSQVPNLKLLWCNGNQITELDIRNLQNLTELWCNGNQITDLDIRSLQNLESLECDPATRIIQRTDQNFK